MLARTSLLLLCLIWCLILCLIFIIFQNKLKRQSELDNMYCLPEFIVCTILIWCLITFSSWLTQNPIITIIYIPKAQTNDHTTKCNRDWINYVKGYLTFSRICICSGLFFCQNGGSVRPFIVAFAIFCIKPEKVVLWTS